MIQELHTASETLRVALERYLDICSTLTSHQTSVGALDNVFETILQEFQKVTSYEKSINHSRGLIGRLRNHYRAIVPVNSLPPEILTRIFYLAHPLKCAMRSPSLLLTMPLRSQTNWILLQVCSYWRTTALGSHDLWTHIDLWTFTPDDEWIVARARQFIPLSSGLPLAVHAKVGEHIMLGDEHRIYELCSLIAPRVNNIDLFFDDKMNEHRLGIYRALIRKCLPGHLTRLTIRTYVDPPSPSLIGTSDANTPELRAPHEYVERVLRHVTTLYLHNVFLHWSSQVYSGLVRLHLEDCGATMSASSLAQVLRASPRLRFLRVGTSLALDTETDLQPVRLNQLEVLRLDFNNLADHETVLSLIHPGTGPLYMNTQFEDEGMPETTQLLITGEHKRFFERSNVVELHASAATPTQPIEIAELLRLLPNLKFLSLFIFDIVHDYESSSLDINTRLAELYLQYVDIELDAIYYIVDKCPIRDIVVDTDGCTLITSEEDEEDEGVDWNKLAVEMHPVIELVDGYWGPGVEDWDD